VHIIRSNKRHLLHRYSYLHWRFKRR